MRNPESIIQLRDIEQKKENTREYFLQIKHSLKNEEKRMQDYNIPDIDTHIDIHNELIRVLVSFEEQIENEDPDHEYINSMIQYTENWLEYHAGEFDRYSEAFIGIESFIQEMDRK